MPPLRAWRAKAARVYAMEWDEIRTRLRQEITKRGDAALFRLGAGSLARDFRASNGQALLRQAQPETAPISGGQFFFAPHEIDAILQTLRARLPNEASTIVECAERICRHQFDLLGFQNLDYGSVINWHCDSVSRKVVPRKLWFRLRYLDFAEVGDHKIVWELNRHQHWVTLAKAYQLTRQERFVTELWRQFRHWQAENPYPTGINWASSLEVAFRSLAWLWAGQLVASSRALPKSFASQLTRALALNARHIEHYLSVYWSPNTHLLGEAVALFFIGTLCPELQSAPRWQAKGWQIVLEQAEKQVKADGMHFEHSVYYHVYALDFFLHARLLAARNGIAVPASLDRTLERMLEALCNISQAGVAPRFGDDDGGRVFDPQRNRSQHLLDPLSTGAVLYSRADFKAASGGVKEETLWLLGAAAAERFDALPSAAPPVRSIGLEASGLYVMSSAAPFPQQLVVDAGPQGTGNSGHGHADALSLQLSVLGEEWLTDPGTLRYISAGAERAAFRGTAAHNTLQVDGRDQAEPIAPFAWRSLPQVRVEHWSSSEQFDLLVASHNGYQKLPQPVVHRRWVFYSKPHFWLVRDLVEGEGEHQLEIFWHFAPPFRPFYTPAGFTFMSASPKDADGAPRGLAILPAQGHGWQQEICRGRFSPAYGIEQSAAVVRFATHARVPAELTVILAPVSDISENTGSLVPINCGATTRAHGYRYDHPSGRHCFFFAEDGRNWTSGSWGSDARFVWLGIKEGIQHLALCSGSYLEVSGQEVITCDRLVERYELVFGPSGRLISCSDPQAAVDCKIENLNLALEAVSAKGEVLTPPPDSPTGPDFSP